MDLTESSQRTILSHTYRLPSLRATPKYKNEQSSDIGYGSFDQRTEAGLLSSSSHIALLYLYLLVVYSQVPSAYSWVVSVVAVT